AQDHAKEDDPEDGDGIDRPAVSSQMPRPPFDLARLAFGPPGKVDRKNVGKIKTDRADRSHYRIIVAVGALIKIESLLIETERCDYRVHHRQKRRDDTEPDRIDRR